MSKGGSKTSTQQSGSGTSAFDIAPDLKSLLFSNYGNAQKLASNYQPYAGELTAPFNNNQNDFLSGLANLSGQQVGTGAMNQGVSAAGGVSGYQAPTVAAGQLSSTDLSPYMNPWTQNVVNTTLPELEKTWGTALQNNNAMATQDNAFGGSRSAVANDLTNTTEGQNVAQTLAQLNSQGFTNAQSAAQGDISNRLTADLANQGASSTAAGLRLNAAGLLGSLGPQQEALAEQQLGLLGQSGYAQQAQRQTGDQNSYAAFLQNLQNELALQQGQNGALGLFPGNYGTTSTQGQSSGTSNTSNWGFKLGFSLPIPGMPISVGG